MRIASLMLGTAALAGMLPLMSPPDMGGGGAATLQNYDPLAPGYVSAEVFAMLSPEQQNAVLTAAPAPAPEPALSLVDPATLPLDDQLRDIRARLDALESAPSVGGGALTPKQAQLLAWAEKVLTKWHSGDKPVDDPDALPVAE